MTLQTWLTYVATVILAVTIPGPGVLLCVNHGMRFGLPRPFSTIAGDLSANTLQIVLLFFLALFPQFLDPGESLPGQISILGVTVLTFDALSIKSEIVDRIS